MNKYVVLVAVLLLLQGCLSGGEGEADSISAPLLGIDFPAHSSLAFSANTALEASQGCQAQPSVSRYTTDGEDLTFHGLAFGTTSAGLPESVEFRLNDVESSFATVPAPATSTDPFFYWEGGLSTSVPPQTLGVGNNSLTVTTASEAGFTSACTRVVRGSSYQAEQAIQYVFDGSEHRWFVLDVVKQALLEVNAPPADSTTEFVRKWPFSMDTALAICGQNRDQSCGGGLVFRRPVDLAFDSVGSRFLVVDRDARAIIAVQLGGMNNGDRTQVADLSGTDPVAITVNNAGDRAFVIDSLNNSVLSVDLALGTFIVLPDDAQVLQNPQDIVFQPANGTVLDRLLVTDRRIADGDNIIQIDVATDTRSLLEPPEIRDNDDEETAGVPEEERTQPNISLGSLGSITILGNTLYVVEGFPGRSNFILTIDISGDTTTDGYGTEGARDILSLLIESTTSDAVVPSGIAFGADGTSDRLLLLDNDAGAIVEVELTTGDTLGELTSLPGSRNVAGESGGELVADLSGLSNIELDDLQRVGSALVSASNRSNALVSLNPASGSVGVAEQVANTVAINDPDVDADATNARAFVDIRTLNVHPVTLEHYLVDAATDTVLVQTADLGSARSIASPPASGVSFVNPLAATFYTSNAVDEDTGIPDSSVLYVLDDIGSAFNLVVVDIDLENNRHSYDDGTVDVDNDGTLDMDSVNVNTNRTALDLSNCTSLTDPSSMVYYQTADEMQRYLVIAESDASELHLVDIVKTGSSATAACKTATFTAPLTSNDIVDIEIDARVADEQMPRLLMLDKSNQAVFAVTIDLSLATEIVTADALPLSADGAPNSANLFISPNAMIFDQLEEKLYVLDDVINSIYTVDLRARDATGQPALGGTVTGQRLVQLRGSAMNCDPDEDSDGDGDDTTGIFTNAACGLQ